MTDATRNWLKAYLAELEKAGNKLLTQIYEDSDGIPNTVVGAGSISLAGYSLATQLATVTDDPSQLVQIIVKHHELAQEKLGPDAWPDVQYGALLHLAMLYLEPAYKVTDSSEVDMRSAAKQWWRSIAEATDQHE